jgi:hypothetical protein
VRKRQCSHHWMIDFAVGPLSRGSCKVCGEERLFRNHLMWSEVVPLGAMNDRRGAGAGPDLPPRSRCRPFMLPRENGGKSLAL